MFEMAVVVICVVGFALVALAALSFFGVFPKTVEEEEYIKVGGLPGGARHGRSKTDTHHRVQSLMSHSGVETIRANSFSTQGRAIEIGEPVDFLAGLVTELSQGIEAMDTYIAQKGIISVNAVSGSLARILLEAKAIRSVLTVRLNEVKNMELSAQDSVKFIERVIELPKDSMMDLSHEGSLRRMEWREFEVWLKTFRSEIKEFYSYIGEAKVIAQ